ncbi:MAG: hypothetical protein ABH830_00710, partial [Patescibacteria group bacterium]
MNTLFYARDKGPSNYLLLLQSELFERLDWPVCSSFFQIRQAEELLNFKPKILIMSLTSLKDNNEKEAEVEIIREIIKRGHLVIIIADSYGTWGRRRMQKMAKKLSAIVASEEEVQLAKDWGYKDAIYLGIPPLWQGFAATPAADFKKPEDAPVIMVGGLKEAHLTDEMLQAVISAMEEIGEKWYLIFKPHPGEEKKDEERRAEILKGINIVDTNFRLDNLLSVVDLSIHIAGATATIIAPYLRAPVISYESDDALHSLFETIPLPYWPPSQMGACAKADQSNMADVI